MNKWKRYKMTDDDLICPVVASAAIATRGIANGKNVPVVFVEADHENRIQAILSIHKTTPEGNCTSSWGFTNNKKVAVLVLDFSDPVQERVVLLFDVIKFGVLVDQILYTQCLFLMVGSESSRLSLCLDEGRLQLEVPGEYYVEEWTKTYRKLYSKHLRKKYNLTQKQAFDTFDKMQEEFTRLKKLRI